MSRKLIYFTLFIFFILPLFGKTFVSFSKYRGKAIKKLERFLNGSEKSVFFSEKEVNEAISENKDFFPPYVQDLKIFLKDGHVNAAFFFYKSAINSDSIEFFLLNFFLKKKNDVFIDIAFKGKSGFGIYDVESVKLNGTAIPNFIVRKLIKTILKRSNFPYLPGEKFPLPFDIKGIDLKSSFLKIYR